MKISCNRLNLLKGITFLFCFFIAMPIQADGTWSTLAPMPTPRSELGAGSINGKIYAVGGGGCSTTLEVYDPASNTWETKAPMPTPRYGKSAGVVNGILHVIDGSIQCGAPYPPIVGAYDPLSNIWTENVSIIPNKPFKRAVGVVDGIIYAVGGKLDIELGTRSIFAFDPASNTWAFKIQLPPYAYCHEKFGLVDSAVGVDNGILYIVGGMCGSGGRIYNNVYAYDPRSNTLTTVAPMRTPRALHSAGVVSGKLYVVGGYTSYPYGAPTATVESYDPSTNTWTTEPSISIARAGSAAAVVNGVLYVIGGLNGGDLAINEAFTPTPNLPPIANAGANQTVHVGQSVSLDGSGSSDPGGLSLTYQWSFDSKPAGSGASLSDPTIVNPTFTPDVPGDYILRLVVTNSAGIPSSPSTVTISTINSPPVADAGPDQSITIIGTNVHLNGSQSYDPDGDPINFNWSFSSKPSGSTVSLIGANTATPSFIADVHGNFVVQLVVSDPWASSLPASVTISFENVKPVANAGTSQSVPIGVVAFLDGSGSTDANGDILSYAWTLASRPANSSAGISAPTAKIASLIPDLPGTYIAQLIVNDGFVNSDPSTVTIQAYATESAAIASVTEIQASVSSIPIPALKNANMKNALINKLNAAIANIDAALYADALAQLKNDILGKTDGCAATGAPDKNDWITTCNEQNKIYPLVQEAIWIVEGLLAP